MRAAAAHLVGEHDFSAFTSAQLPIQNKVRTVYSIKIVKKGDLITIDVVGNGFLYNMVRIIAGTLIYVGQGKLACRGCSGYPCKPGPATRRRSPPSRRAFVLAEVRYK